MRAGNNTGFSFLYKNQSLNADLNNQDFTSQIDLNDNTTLSSAMSQIILYGKITVINLSLFVTNVVANQETRLLTIPNKIRPIKGKFLIVQQSTSEWQSNKGICYGYLAATGELSVKIYDSSVTNLKIFTVYNIN